MRGRSEVRAGDPCLGDLCAEIERRLREAGTPARAVGAKAYLKSSMEFAGVTLPVIRRIVSDVTRGRSLSRENVRGLAEELWNRPLFECRLVAYRGASYLGRGKRSPFGMTTCRCPAS